MSEAQVEMIKQYGVANPHTGLHIKTKGYHFGSSLEVFDPVTNKKVKKDFKPFLVDNSVLVFERGKIALNENDKILKKQLNGYRIEKIGSSGRPIFSSKDEHSVDTLNLCLLTFQMEYDSLFKIMIKNSFRVFKVDNDIKEEWNDRTIEPKVVNSSFEFLEGRKKTQVTKSKKTYLQKRFVREHW